MNSGEEGFKYFFPRIVTNFPPIIITQALLPFFLLPPLPLPLLSPFPSSFSPSPPQLKLGIKCRV